jgi:hypothetical protein
MQIVFWVARPPIQYSLSESGLLCRIDKRFIGVDITVQFPLAGLSFLVYLEKITSIFNQCAKYEFASSNITRTTFASDACFVWKLAPLADERSGFFIDIATIDAIEHVLNVANSYLAYRHPCFTNIN